MLNRPLRFRELLARSSRLGSQPRISVHICRVSFARWTYACGLKDLEIRNFLHQLIPAAAADRTQEVGGSNPPSFIEVSGFRLLSRTTAVHSVRATVGLGESDDPFRALAVALQFAGCVHVFREAPVLHDLAAHRAPLLSTAACRLSGVDHEVEVLPHDLPRT